MKTTLIWMLSGALVGIAAASFIVPRALGWYVAPGGLPAGAQVQALVAIPDVVRYSTGKLIYWQWISAALGAAAGLALSIVLKMRARRARLDASAAAKAAARPTVVESLAEGLAEGKGQRAEGKGEGRG